MNSDQLLSIAPNGRRPMFCRFSDLQLRTLPERRITIRTNLNTLQAKIYNTEHRIALGVFAQMA